MASMSNFHGLSKWLRMLQAPVTLHPFKLADNSYSAPSFRDGRATANEEKFVVLDKAAMNQSEV